MTTADAVSLYRSEKAARSVRLSLVPASAPRPPRRRRRLPGPFAPFRCGHASTEANAYVNSLGHRVCRTCKAQKAKAARASRRIAS